MANYSEIEELFRHVLEEKDRFRILAMTDEICRKLKEAEFRDEYLASKEQLVESTESLLSIYSITFNEIMWKRIRVQMGKVLECIEASDN